MGPDSLIQSNEAALREKYNLKRVSLNLEDRALELYKVDNLDDLLDQVEEPDQIPFWAELWPASIGLAQYILRHQQGFFGKRILELGAGVGLSGMAAVVAGGRVIQSDFAAAAFEFLKLNFLINRLPQPEFLLADWRDFPAIDQVDLIIGSDILYEKTVHHCLIDIFRRVLAPGGLIVLADPGRDYARQFINNLSEQGWRVEAVQIPLTYQDQSVTVNIYQIQP